MRKLIYLICVSVLLTNCDDGDVITVNLEFDNTFKYCGSLVLYKTKTNPAESLSIFLANRTIESFVETTFIDTDSVFVALTSDSISVTLDGSTNKLNYRTYSALPTNPFCNDIPSSELNIINDAVGTGTAIITTTLEEDDNDGIPSEFEDINGNGDLNDDDTDGDGVPNYLDDDDDGDNVKTINEFVNYEVANNLTNALDTDGDGIPNYLDNDDDGDNVPTRDERSLFPSEHNPATNITNQDVGPDYLNSAVSLSELETVYRSHTIRQQFVVSIQINNLSIPQLSLDELYFGVLSAPSITTDTRSPKTIFN